jgi:hypothetical protein
MVLQSIVYLESFTLSTASSLLRRATRVPPHHLPRLRAPAGRDHDEHWPPFHPHANSLHSYDVLYRIVAFSLEENVFTELFYFQ